MDNFYKLLLGYIIAIIFTGTAQATVRYVNLNNNSGTAPYTSWTTAGNDLQTVINGSIAGDEIWIAAGTYKPNSLPPDATPSTIGGMTVFNERDHTFFVKDGIKIYGGFSGIETQLTQRNIITNETILSGDIGIHGNISDNCYHVLVAADGNIGTVIDGFTIIKGNANSYTGGMIINNHFIYRACGGGIYVGYGKSTIANNKLYDSFGGNGGALYMQYGFITVSNNMMYNNTANYGPATHAENNTSVISGNTIYNNSASIDGGAIIAQYSTNTITNNNIYNNMARTGGAIMITSGTSSITGNIIYKNKATNGVGGGIYLNYGTNTLLNNVLYENTSTAGGGAILSSGNNTFTNTIVYKNSSSTGGGFHLGAGTHILNNNTLYNNSASTNGGGIYTNNGNGTLKNNILWDNRRGNSAVTAGSDYFNYNNTTTLSFSNNLLQLPGTLYTTANFNFLGSNPNGNIFDQNPSFGDPANPLGADGIPLTADDGLALQNNSVCRDAGAASSIPDFDCTGAPRTGIPNIGAYEVVFAVLATLESPDISKFKLYPNPVKHVLYLSEELKNIHIISAGSQIMNIQANKNNIDVSQLTEGIYFITGEDKMGNIVSKKFIKE